MMWQTRAQLDQIIERLYIVFEIQRYQFWNKMTILSILLVYKMLIIVEVLRSWTPNQTIDSVLNPSKIALNHLFEVELFIAPQFQHLRGQFHV